MIIVYVYRKNDPFNLHLKVKNGISKQLHRQNAYVNYGKREE